MFSVFPQRHAAARPRQIFFLVSVSAALALCGLVAADEPAKLGERNVFPALGMTAERKVQVEWNRFYDTAGHAAILSNLHKAFPKLTKVYSLGKSIEGRDLTMLELTAREKGDPARKPGMYIDGNIHGNEVQGSEVVSYTAWYLCHQYGKVDFVTDLLDHYVFYLLPTINPDGRDHWLYGAQNTHTSRTGLRPFDNDRDGDLDEDDVDDLNGDGSISMMRIKDPHGRMRPGRDFPELMDQVAPDQKGQYTMLGWEGVDNDGDGQINEDPAGGYDMNRNWGWDWQPNHIQFGAQEYPFSLPETRAVADFILNRPNIAAAQTYHNFGGMILRSPGREGGMMRGSDESVLLFISQRGEKMLPFYRSMIIWKDLYTVWGGEIDWLYAGCGIIALSNELWTWRNLDKGAANATSEEQQAFLKYVMLNEGVVDWKEHDHPTYGRIEIGGVKKQWNRTPPSFLLEEECHRNMAFTLYHASQMPRLKIADIQVEKLAPDLSKVWVTVENSRLIPTRTEQDSANNINPPDFISLQGEGLKVLSSGRVTDKYFKRVEAVKSRPHRVPVSSIPGMNVVRVQFLVEGKGKFTVTVDSAKGGLVKSEERTLE